MTGTLTEERREAIAAELGDVLWYAAQLATEAGLDLEAIAEANLEKLASRQRRSVLQGSGDNCKDGFVAAPSRDSATR